MSTTSRLLIVATAAAFAAACAPVQQASSSVQLPGEPPKNVAGLQVPPEAWAHPTVQTASAPARR
jgi:hypothetical protein